MDLFRRILVPHDFSKAAARALEVAAGLARAHRGRLLVLHVVSPLPSATMFPEQMAAWIPPAELVVEARRQLEAVVARTVTGAGAPPVECRVVLGDPHGCILAAARDADTIVMSTAGRSGLPHLLIGSVAEKVVRHASVPVLTVRPGARTRARARHPVRGRVGRSRAARRR
jgi:universal stress protein A